MAKHYRSFISPDNNVNVDVEKPHDNKEAIAALATNIAKQAEKNVAEDKKEEVKKDIPKIARVVVDLVNVRKLPSLDAEIVATVTKGAEFKVDINASRDGFTAINFGGAIAFIKKDLVEVFDNPAYTSNKKTSLGD